MEIQETLSTLQQILAPKELSYLEELIIIYSWDGRSYREMALETAYDEGYLKDLGSQLWRLLSDRLGVPISKKTLRLLLTEISDAEQMSRPAPATSPVPAPDGVTSPASNPASILLEFPDSPLPFASPLYIKRLPIEELAVAMVNQPGSLIRLKAPWRMGKTSLLNHILGTAARSGVRPVLIDIRQADVRVLEDIDQFLRWFCLVISQQLGIHDDLNSYWFEQAGSKLSCTTYVQEHLLNQMQDPIGLALDTVHYLVNYPQIARDFFPMLRSWYEQSKVHPTWQKLRLMMAYSAELDFPLQVNQSPFNVGLLLELPAFTKPQAEALVTSYGLDQPGICDDFQLLPLLSLVGGHPYLLQLALYWLRWGHYSFTQLMQQAPTTSGIYQEHLRSLLGIVQQDEAVLQGLHQVLSRSQPAHLAPRVAHQLESIGLVQINGLEPSIRCDLYRQYFGKLLEVEAFR